MLFKLNRATYGTRRLKQVLAGQNLPASRRRIGRLMGELGLAYKTKRKFKATTNSAHESPIAENVLNRAFSVEKPNQAYVGDITYISTQEGWLMSERMQASLVNDALMAAIWQRKPPKGLIWHTDRGSQYASESHRLLLAQHGIIQSMSRKGNCWDNAVSESFFHTLKTELTHHENY
jgi:transposase InsO family protein